MPTPRQIEGEKSGGKVAATYGKDERAQPRLTQAPDHSLVTKTANQDIWLQYGDNSHSVIWHLAAFVDTVSFHPPEKELPLLLRHQP